MHHSNDKSMHGVGEIVKYLKEDESFQALMKTSWFKLSLATLGIGVFALIGFGVSNFIRKKGDR